MNEMQIKNVNYLLLSTQLRQRRKQMLKAIRYHMSSAMIARNHKLKKLGSQGLPLHVHVYSCFSGVWVFFNRHKADLRNKFQWHHLNFPRDPLRSYFDEPQKNEIHFFIYIYISIQPFNALFSTFSCKVCKLHGEQMLLTDAFGHYVQQPSS